MHQGASLSLSFPGLSIQKLRLTPYLCRLALHHLLIPQKRLRKWTQMYEKIEAMIVSIQILGP